MTNVSANNTASDDFSAANPLLVPAAKRVRSPKTTQTVVGRTITTAPVKPSPVVDRRHWFVRWLARDEAIGMVISLSIHATALLVLGLIVMSGVNKPETINLWGVVGESQDAGNGTEIDTALPGDTGEAAMEEMTSLAQPLESLSSSSQLPEMGRVGASGLAGLGGAGGGNGDGEGGTGISLGAGVGKVPGHAQTKGSFTAWADPRDPKPDENYHIVIQVRLPSGVKKYRAADLTGRVIGTDGYRQPIRFDPTEQTDVEEGVVELRIFVPGGARKVRDTVKVESKVLREKQTFEIEF